MMFKEEWVDMIMRMTKKQMLDYIKKLMEQNEEQKIHIELLTDYLSEIL